MLIPNILKKDLTTRKLFQTFSIYLHFSVNFSIIIEFENFFMKKYSVFQLKKK